MREISLTAIAWVHGRPDHFNCYVCRDKPATWQRQIEISDNGAVVNLVLCTVCATMPVQDVIDIASAM